MSLAILQPEQGDDRNPEVAMQRQHELDQVAGLHRMTDNQFSETGFVPDIPGKGIGERILFQQNFPNTARAVGNITVRRVHMKPGLLPKIQASKPVYKPQPKGALDPAIMPAPTEVPTDNYIS